MPKLESSARSICLMIWIKRSGRWVRTEWPCIPSTLRLVHDKIYSANAGMDRTCLGTYLGELAASLLRFHGKEVSTKVRLLADVERLEVHPDCTVPLGLHRLPARLG